MSLFSELFGYAAFAMLLALVLYVAFGQITVRKLRRNPGNEHALGVEFASGWDIFNVAQALALPRSWTKKLESSHLSALYANSETLRRQTTPLDRALAATFFWLFTMSGFAIIGLVALNSLGVFD